MKRKKTASCSQLLLMCVIGCMILTGAKETQGVDLKTWIETVKRVGPEGKGHEAAIQAMSMLSKQPADSIPQLLEGMNGANRLAVNWLRSAVESAADKGNLPLAEIKSFLEKKDNSPFARRLAFELIVAASPEQKKAMLLEMLDDPSLEIRRDAVELELSKIKALTKQSEKIAGYRKALSHSREIAQIKLIADALSELGEKVNQVKHFGMIMQWHVAGPFENKDQAKFNQAYPPEENQDLKQTFTGMDGIQFGWKQYQSSDEEGIVDLNKALANHKGAIAYAYSDFYCDNPRQVDVRLACINANKVWINGKLVISNDVYHAGMNLDQYIAKASFKKGANTILIKVCQNEQTESWAQRWQFQIRVTDDTGKALVDEKQE